MSRWTNAFKIDRRIARCSGLSLLRVTAIMLGMAALVHATAPTLTEFPIPTPVSLPAGIATGPDGNVWFTEASGNKIGQITPDGQITEFPLPPAANGGPNGIAAGPDGNMWFTEQTGNIGRITPAGVLTEFSVGFGPQGITAGPDGNLWFTATGFTDRIGRITPAGLVTQFSLGTPGTKFVLGITAGPDGNLWFTELSGNKIGQITPAGVITEYSIPTAGSNPWGITAGPDGNLWFTESAGKIGTMTTTSPETMTEYTVGTGTGRGLRGIAAGPDGNLWFAEVFGSRIGQITPAGVISESATPTPVAVPSGITAGPDGNIWFTESGSGGNNIGRVTLVTQLDPPTIAKTFGAPSVALGFNTSLTFTLGNPNPAAVGGVGFGDPLPAGMIVATPNALSNTCGGTVTAPPNSNSINLTGGSIAANGTCTVSVAVTGNRVGFWTNKTESVTSTEGGTGGIATAGLEVTPPQPNCQGVLTSNLAQQYGGLSNAASALGFPSVQALKDAIRQKCGG